MKLKRLLAATAVATIASSAVMAEGTYIGLEFLDSRYSYKENSYGGDHEATTMYFGNKVDLSDTVELDARIDFEKADATETFIYSAKLTKEINNLELYGSYSYLDQNNFDYYQSSRTGSALIIGAQYNFNNY